MISHDEQEAAEAKNFGLPSKQDFDLFIEDNNVKLPIFRVRRQLKKQVETVFFSKDEEIFLVMDLGKFTKKQQAFLRTVDGFNFMLSSAKSGTVSVSQFKKLLKEYHDNL